MRGESASRIRDLFGLAVCLGVLAAFGLPGLAAEGPDGPCRPGARRRAPGPVPEARDSNPVTRTYSQELAAGWNLVSLGVSNGADPLQIFGPGCTAVRRWDTAAGGYVTPGSLLPAEGCEVQMAATARVSVSGTPVPAPLALAMGRGWNQAGNPYSIPMPWALVRAVRGGHAKTVGQAVAAGWIGRPEVVVNGARRKVNLKKDLLSVGQGFWLKVKSEGVALSFETQKAWTIMAYLDGDDSNMNIDFSTAFEKLVADRVGSDELVNLVVQFDRIPGDERFGGWPIAHRFFVTPGMEPTEENAIQDWGDGRGGREVEMNDPATLSAFIEWAAENYPAGRYVLLIGDHGFGWQGLCIDMTSFADSMPLKGFAAALASSPVPFDILALDLCSMGNAEVLDELKVAPAGVVVASEAPGDAWPLWDIFRVPVEDPGIGSEEWAARMVDLYADYNEGIQRNDETLAAFRLPVFGAVTQATRALSEACVDESMTVQVPQLALAVREALSAARIHERHGALMPGARGLGVYFPKPDVGYTPEVFNCCYKKETASFVEDALWRHVLMSYYMMFYGMYVDPRFAHARPGLQDFDSGEYVDLDSLCQAIAEGAGE